MVQFFMNYINSPIEQITFNSRKYFIKRDDLLHKDFSGNKARKLYYFLKNDFPNIKKVVSHGSAQSNAMYSLSVLCKIKDLSFDYYVDHIASFLKENPSGNYKYALENKMNIIDAELPKTFEEDTLFISEGGAVSEACFGIEILANEIISWANENKIEKCRCIYSSAKSRKLFVNTIFDESNFYQADDIYISKEDIEQNMLDYLEIGKINADRFK